MEVPPGYVLVGRGTARGVVREDLADEPLARWWEEGTAIPAAPGRGGVRLLGPLQGGLAVARDYRRGGMLGGFLGNRYLDRTRALRELGVLAHLVRAGVPAVDPLAAVWRREGLTWRLRLVTRLVDGSLPLPRFLAAHPRLTRHALHEAGRVTELAFRAGLVHPDLHPDNMLAYVDRGAVRVLLVDLDRAMVRDRVSQDRRDRMLLRMARYVEKHRGSLPFDLRFVHAVRFLRGMGLGRRDRRVLLTRLGPMHRRAVARRRALWARRRSLAG